METKIFLNLSMFQGLIRSHLECTEAT